MVFRIRTSIYFLALVLITFHQSPVVNSANILFFFGVSTLSHKLLVWPLVETLSNQGHNITFFSPFPEANPNPKIHEFSPIELQHFMHLAYGTTSDFLNIRMNNGHQSAWHKMLPGLAIAVCDVILGDQESLEWLNSSNFDLVIIDSLFNDCGLGLAWKFGASHVMFGTTSIFMWEFDSFGLPAESSSIPDISMDFPQEMSFLQRVSNTIRPIAWNLYRTYVMYPKLESRFRDAFKQPDMPDLSEIERNTSLILHNMHYSLDYSRSIPPIVVPVGGLHVKTEYGSIYDDMPNDMRTFLDGSGSQGFIYSSFGSVVQMSRMSKDMRQIFLSTFGNLSLSVLWKYEPENPQELPTNVFASKWMPQQSILKHPNIKGFITHGGLLSIEEAVYNEVPLIVMPVFADQDYNAENIGARGIGVTVHFNNLNQTVLENAINEIVYNQTYKENAIEVSKMFKDRPMQPLDEAVWWIEYVLRNPNAGKFMRPLNSKQTWFQRRLLDVWLFISVISLIFFVFFIALSLSVGNVIYKMFVRRNQLTDCIETDTVKSNFIDSNGNNHNVNNNDSPVYLSYKNKPMKKIQ